MQILGGLGITDDTIVSRLFRDVRPFRIYDGPSEVHRWSIAPRVLRAGGAVGPSPPDQVRGGLSR
jgi:acyl-CoA dehydrogenase